MKSNTRIDAQEALKYFLTRIRQSKTSGTLLYSGVAGDKDGCEYRELFDGFTVKTLDVNAKYNPDYVMDITKTSLFDSFWDVVVILQTIEHVPNIWDLSAELYRIVKSQGFVIVDSPWNFPIHKEDDFGDYYRFTCDGLKQLFGDYFIVDSAIQTDYNSSVLLRKS